MAANDTRTLPMKTLLASALLAAAAGPALAQVAAPVPPHDHHPVITTSSELRTWCRREAETRFVAEGRTTYQWTASHHSRGNVLHVNGTLRVEGIDYLVECRIARGAREHYGNIEITERTLP